MRVKAALLASGLMLFPANNASPAEAMAASMKKEHGEQIFHMLRLEADAGVDGDEGVFRWDADGRIGNDENKLWVKSEGEGRDGRLEKGELWAMYGRNVAAFWDAQAGVRYDFEPRGNAYFVAGATGLAQYNFETQAHLFISDDGDVTARLREENDFLITQKLILRPYAELNLSAQDVPEQNIGAGVSDGMVGLQARHEFTRKFAPYLDVGYRRRFGETASFAEDDGTSGDGWIGAAGLRLMF